MDAIMIKDEIDKLKKAPTSWYNLQRLGTLLTVYDHLVDNGTPVMAQSLVDVMPDCGAGEFEKAISRKEIYPLVEVLSEHMAVIKTLYPKEYDALLDQIEELP